MLDNVTPVQPDGCQIKGIMWYMCLPHGIVFVEYSLQAFSYISSTIHTSQGKNTLCSIKIHHTSKMRPSDVLVHLEMTKKTEPLPAIQLLTVTMAHMC